jgi:hypothetical protein
VARKAYKILQTIGVVAAVLHMTACGSNPSLTKSPGIPGASENSIASGPILDAWWDSASKGLRTVYGVAGAAHQGPPTYNDGSYVGGSVCMRKSIALFAASSGNLFSVSLPQGKPLAIASKGLPNATIVFSPSCTWSLAYATGSSTALLLQELLSTPTSTAVTLPAGTSAAAVSDSGSILVNVPKSDGSNAIQFQSSGSSTLQTIAVLSGFGGMAFLPGADSALFADAAASSVFEASHITSGMSLVQIAGEADGVSKPVAVAISADGRTAAVANSKSSSVLRLDLSGQSAPVQIVCHCSPTELKPLGGNLVFRLNEAGTGTVWAFDGDASVPRFIFIPTEQVASAAKGVSR